MSLKWLDSAVKPLASAAYQYALARQLSLTKPPGSLGRLEDLACRLCGMQNSDRPQLEKVHITVFAADHGIAAEGVSAFPQIVTREMVRNFSAGGAAISVLARAMGAQFEVIDCGVCNDPGQLEGLVSSPVAPGTANFAKGPAMTEEQLAAALQIGRDAVANVVEQGADCFIAGEMGIANTTAATALACALLAKPARQLAGPGTGLDDVGLNHKIEVIQKALDLHSSALKSPLDVLRRLGGLEIAAIVGAYIAAAQAGLPVIVDGFIASSAALVATRINREAGTWWFHSHASAEPGHRFIMAALGAEPLLDLGMRLGEGSGAAVAVPLLRQACALHNDMATFEQAGVSEKHG